MCGDLGARTGRVTPRLGGTGTERPFTEPTDVIRASLRAAAARPAPGCGCCGAHLRSTATRTLLVTLHGAPLGLLAADAQVVQQAGHMAAVKTHPEGLVDEASDPAGRPQFRIKTVCDRASRRRCLDARNHGAHVGELHGAERHRSDCAEFDDACALRRVGRVGSGVHVSSLCRLALFVRKGRAIYHSPSGKDSNKS